MLRQSIITATLCLVAIACDNNPAEGKVKAETKEVAADQVVTKIEPAAAHVMINFDESSGKVGFVGAKVTGSHEGSFEKFKGTLHIIEAKPESSKVEVDIDMNSLIIEPAKLKGHLLSEDFFASEKFPTAKFVSTSLVPIKGKPGSFDVTGQLTLHGKTNEIKFPAVVAASATASGIKTEFAINRKDFGIVYPGMPDDLISDNVLIKLDISAKK
jgi:polyisoprenoid-binding protein YceI